MKDIEKSRFHCTETLKILPLRDQEIRERLREKRCQMVRYGFCLFKSVAGEGKWGKWKMCTRTVQVLTYCAKGWLSREERKVVLPESNANVAPCPILRSTTAADHCEDFGPAPSLETTRVQKAPYEINFQSCRNELTNFPFFIFQTY